MNIRLSPDGQRVAVESQESPNSDIWIHDAARGTRTRFTFESGDETDPTWSPDGSRIVFASNRGSKRKSALYEKAANGFGDARVLLEDASDIWPQDWSADGRYLAFMKGEYATRSGTDIWVMPMTGNGKPFPLATTSFDEADAAFSPDSRFVAYTSAESGRREIYLTSLRDPSRPATGAQANDASAGGGRWQVSTSGGSLPRWRRDGKELFYVKQDNATVVGVPVDPARSSLIAGPETALFLAFQTWGLASYDVTPDGQHFIVNTFDSGASKPIAVVVNWTADLKAR